MTAPPVSVQVSEHKPAAFAANLVFIAAGLAAMGWCGYCIASHSSHLYARLLPAVVILLAIPLLFRMQASARMVGASVFAGLVLGIYGVEALALVLVDPDRPALQAMETAAKQDGVAYDGRTRLEVVADLRARGIDAYPPFYPYLLFDSPLRIGSQPGLPLGSMANTFTVCCNEGGQYLKYTTDEHGFRNPPGSWSAAPIDLAIVGASSASSECVDDPDSLTEQLRQRYPRIVTLGAGGNGPLLELATIREYLPALKPRHVLWLFGETHTPEYLEGEAHNAFVRQYLDPAFSQGLLQKQPEIDRAVARYFDSGIQAEEIKRTPAHRAVAFADLKDERMLMYYFVTARSAKPQPAPFDIDLYEQALREGVRTVSQWGGTVDVVYFPDSSRYPGVSDYSAQNQPKLDRTHSQILSVAARVGVPVIDLLRSFPNAPVTGTGANARYFYPFPAHPRPAGYRFAAREIMTAMSRLP